MLFETQIQTMMGFKKCYFYIQSIKRKKHKEQRKKNEKKEIETFPYSWNSPFQWFSTFQEERRTKKI